MLKKWLVATLFLFILGLSLVGLSFCTTTQSESVEQQIGNQIGASIVKFTAPANFSGVVTINASGFYTIGNPTMLKIVNQTGTLEYYEQVVDFPIQAHLFNSSGEYVATFENLEVNDSTALTVKIEETINKQSYPYENAIFVSIIPLCLGFYSINLSFDKDSKYKELIKTTVTFEIVAITIFGLSFGISSSFPDYVKVQAAIDLMKALAEAAGVMLGLSGIMFAQLYSSIMGFQNIIFEHALTGKHNANYEICLKEFSDRKKVLALATIGSISFFLGSILTSLMSLVTVESYDLVKDTYAPFGLLLLPIFFLVEAIALLVVALVGLPMETPKSIIEKLSQQEDDPRIGKDR